MTAKKHNAVFKPACPKLGGKVCSHSTVLLSYVSCTCPSLVGIFPYHIKINIRKMVCERHVDPR